MRSAIFRRSMFGMGIWEMVVIAIVALLVVGPDKLPETAKKLSQGIRDFRKQTRDLQKTLDEDTELGDAVRDLKSALRGDEFRMAARAADKKPKPKPAVTGTSPALPLPKGNVAAKDVNPPTPEPAPEPEAEGAEVAQADSPAADPDMPIVKSADGTVAKGAADDDELAHG